MALVLLAVLAVLLAVQDRATSGRWWRGDFASYRRHSAGAWALGATIIAYALLVYPVLGYVLGHRYPAAPTFGVPCPTTLFTLGLLVWAGRQVPWWMFVVPLAWSGIAMSAATNVGMTEDFALLVFGIATVCWLAFSWRSATQRPIVSTS